MLSCGELIIFGWSPIFDTFQAFLVVVPLDGTFPLAIGRFLNLMINALVLSLRKLGKVTLKQSDLRGLTPCWQICFLLHWGRAMVR